MSGRRDWLSARRLVVFHRFEATMPPHALLVRRQTLVVGAPAVPGPKHAKTERPTRGHGEAQDRRQHRGQGQGPNAAPQPFRRPLLLRDGGLFAPHAHNVGHVGRGALGSITCCSD
jgi:hypothetical protein